MVNNFHLATKFASLTAKAFTLLARGSLEYIQIQSNEMLTKSASAVILPFGAPASSPWAVVRRLGQALEVIDSKEPGCVF